MTLSDAEIIEELDSWGRFADALVDLTLDGDTVSAQLLTHRNRLPGLTTFRLKQLLRATGPGGVR